MIPSSSDPTRPPLEIRGPRASSVIVQRIPPQSAEAFLEWQRGISAASAEFPGYQTTEIYPPVDGGRQEWVVVIHFDDSKRLRDWLDSPRRAEWMAKNPCEVQGYRLKMLPAGFGSWFAGLGEDGGPLPHWKMSLTVLFGLYPTVMLLTFFLSPHTARFGLAVAMLIGNAASVAFLEWLGMPVLSRLLGPWLRANGKEGRTLSVVGLILIVGALGLMTFLFSLATRRP
jgi:antibiotic biosynthesis monooxygenase (ABM) superfamily enzyme